MVGHAKLAVVSMTWKFGTFTFPLQTSSMELELFVCLFFEMLRFSELVGLHADTKLFYCVYVQMAN